MPGSFRRFPAFSSFQDVLGDLPRGGLAFPYELLSFAFRRPQQTNVRHGVKHGTRFGGDRPPTDDYCARHETLFLRRGSNWPEK